MKPAAARKPRKAAAPPLPLPPPPNEGPRSILDLFALQGRAPRPVQADAILQAQAAFDAGKRFVVLEGPPGLGKSGAGVTLARYFNRAWILTVSKLLQAQYFDDFGYLGLKELKGRSSFDCARANDDCDVGGTLFTGQDKCISAQEAAIKGKHAGIGGFCPYLTARTEAMGANLTVCNYSSFLYNVREPEADRRPLLILDEAHETEKVLMDFVSVSINLKTLPVNVAGDSPGPKASIDECWAFLGRLLDALRIKSKVTRDAVDKIKLERLRAKVSYALFHKDAEEWIVEPWEKTEGFTLKPLTVASFGEKIFQFADRVLLMSATILDFNALCSSLGIPPGEAEFIQAPCTFPKENRPVVVGRLPMNMQARSASWPVMVEAIEAIFTHHKGEKGLLLVPSNAMLKYIQENLSRAHAVRLIVAFGNKRMEAYGEHLRSKQPSVLMASGMWEGIDLKDDLSRFQIIPALPRPMWAGQIAARAKLDPRWYRWRTMTQLVQGIGRSVRSETDSATTYVLDQAFRDEFDRPRSMLPAWLKEAVVFHDA